MAFLIFYVGTRHSIHEGWSTQAFEMFSL